MSHSRHDPKRGWDAGMRDNDFVSIVVFKQNEESPISLTQASPVQFVGVEEMRNAFASHQVSYTEPKGVEEGSEIRVVWPSGAAKLPSVVEAVETGWVKLRSIPERKPQSVKLSRKTGRITLLPQVVVGDTVETNQIVASVVPVRTAIPCPPPVSEDYFIDKLSSVSLSERYGAAKSLRYRGYTFAKLALESRMNDSDEDIYVQLEAAAALAAYDDEKGWEFIETKLRSSDITVPLETQLETIIVASEISKPRSEQLLLEILGNPDRNDELRAGAAWALGQFATTASATALAHTFNSSPLEIKTEAARSLLRIAEPQIPYLLELLEHGAPTQRDGLSWVLARTGSFNPADMITEADDDLRRWLSYIVGYGKDQFTREDIDAICKKDPEVYFAASVLWQIVASWIYDLREY